MDIGFDISQTGTGKAGCGYYTHAMIKAMLSIAPQHDYSLYPSFGDFYFDAKMPFSNPYRGHSTSYGPRHLTRKTASASEIRPIWTQLLVIRMLSTPTTSGRLFSFPPLGLFTRFTISVLRSILIGPPKPIVLAVLRACFAPLWQQTGWWQFLTIPVPTISSFFRIFPVIGCALFIPARALMMQGNKVRRLRQQSLDVGGFWLSVGTIEPQKINVCWSRPMPGIFSRAAPSPLVLAGGRGWLMEDFQNYLVELGISDRVVLTGYLSDNELIWLYRNCYANLYPSVFEGFGLPVLEGMRFGAPTLSSNSTSMPEVAGDAATMLNPHDQHAWTQAMLELASDHDGGGRMDLAASARALTFDWNRSATAMLAIYEEATHSPKRAHLNQKGDDKNGIARAENVGHVQT